MAELILIVVDISKLISWYTDAREKAILKSKAYSDNQNVVSAQNEKLNDVIVHAEKNFKNNPVVKLFYGQYLFKKQKLH